MAAPLSGKVDLTGQVAFITGGAGGIGTAAAEVLAREGADVVVADIADGSETVKRVERLGRRAMALYCDVTDRASVQDAVSQAISRMGKVDILVLCAGFCPNTHLENLEEDEWYRTLDVNLKGVFLPVQALWSHMKENGYGKIVCLGSVAASVGGVKSGPHYVAAKAGVHGFVKWVAKNGAKHGIYINAIAPGPVQTQMWEGVKAGSTEAESSFSPLGRIGRVEDVAEAILYLAGNASNWITGIVLDINGGMYMG